MRLLTKHSADMLAYCTFWRDMFFLWRSRLDLNHSVINLLEAKNGTHSTFRKSLEAVLSPGHALTGRRDGMMQEVAASLDCFQRLFLFIMVFLFVLWQ